MNNKATTRRSKEQWREIIAAQAASGQSISAYCRGKDFSDKSFYIWRKKLKIKSDGQPVKFLEVTTAVKGQEPSEVLQVHTPGGYRLEVPRGFQGDTLKSVLTVLNSI